MATEVIAQLAGVAEDIKYQQEMARIACDRQYEWELVLKAYYSFIV
jgi:hypothetical protein